jgi:tetratricopeptide (TPR) repeat protein
MDPRLRRVASWPFVVLAIPIGGCSTNPNSVEVLARDRAIAANESSRHALGTHASTGVVVGTGSSAAQAEETAARRAAMRRAVGRARTEQDEAYDKRSDDQAFIDAYKTNDRNDAVKLYLLGRAFGKLERIKEADLEFQAAALADPNNPWPYEGLGICYFLSKEPDRAIAQLSRALTVDPDLAEARFALARALDSQHRTEEAIAEAEKLVLSDDDPGRGPRLLADLHLKRNDLPKAIDALAAGVKRAPDNVELRLDYADVLGRAGRTADAAAELDAALTKGKIPPDRLLAFAIVYRRADRFDRSLELLARLLNEAPGDYWRSHSREEIEKLRDQVQKEKELGYRVEYSIEELINMLTSHPDLKKRQLAADALRQFPFLEVDQAYVKAIKDPSPQIRAVVISELERRVGIQALGAFCAIARGDADPRVRATACRALSRMESPEAEAALVAALGDTDTIVREAANAALEAMTGRILRPSGVGSLAEPERSAVQLEWKEYLAERRKANAPPKK